MASHSSELYVWYHREPQGRGLPSPRRLFKCGIQRAQLAYGRSSCVFVDTANVSLQRMVFPLDVSGQRWRVGLFASGARRCGLSSHRRPQSNALLRRPRGVEHLVGCVRRTQSPGTTSGQSYDCGCAAAGGDHSGYAGSGHRRDSRIWPDGNLWSSNVMRVARGLMGFVRCCKSGAIESASGG